MRRPFLIILASALILIGAGCAKKTTSTNTTPEVNDSLNTNIVTTHVSATNTAATNVNQAATLPAGYDKFFNHMTVRLAGDTIVVTTNDLPDHKSPYYPKSSSMYEPYSGTRVFRQNPNTIQEQSLTFRLPRTPVLDSRHTETPLGPIGVALNGVPFFNQYAAQRRPLTDEVDSFDQHNGHPQQQGEYHYHIAPPDLMRQFGNDALLGFLLDGFPVYGSTENGKTVTNADLDAYHGHTHATKEYPNGIYHYHFTTEAPYLNGDGFYGAPGTVSCTIWEAGQTLPAPPTCNVFSCATIQAL